MAGLGEASADAGLGSGDDGGDIVRVLVGVSFGVVDTTSFEICESDIVVLLSRGVPNTDVLVETGVAGFDGSDLPSVEAKAVEGMVANALDPFGAKGNPFADVSEVTDPKGFGVRDANAANAADASDFDSCEPNPDGCFEVSAKLVADVVDPKSV
jgi:hypothetical protein